MQAEQEWITGGVGQVWATNNAPCQLMPLNRDSVEVARLYRRRVDKSRCRFQQIARVEWVGLPTVEIAL